MDNEVFDNVKFEKAKAIARYNRFQNLMRMIQIFEVIVALVLVSWSWTRVPAAVKLSGEFLAQITAFLFKPHVVFLIGNGIIVAIVVLCRQTDAGIINNSVNVNDNDEIQIRNSVNDNDEISVNDNDQIQIRYGEVENPVTVNDLTEYKYKSPLSTVPLVKSEDKQIVLSENKEKLQCNDVITAIDSATKQIQKFKRTQSEKLKREITASPRRELRRSETDMIRKRSPIEAVDTLSNEEFRHTIEAFIKKNQLFFEKQRLAESEHEKYERIGIEAF